MYPRVNLKCSSGFSSRKPEVASKARPEAKNPGGGPREASDLSESHVRYFGKGSNVCYLGGGSNGCYLGGGSHVF